MNPVLWLTDCGNLGVLLPLATAILLWLVLVRGQAAAGWWIAAVAACLAVTALAKIYFYACPIADVRSPSGHTSVSTLVYGALAMIVAAATTGAWRATVVAAAAAFILSIAVSRLLLIAHSAPEIAMGTAIGLLALALFAVGYGRFPPARVRLWPLLLAAGIVALAMHGQQVNDHGLLNVLGLRLQQAVIACA